MTPITTDGRNILLTVEVDGQAYHLEEYDSIRFKGDRPHKYINPSSSLTILHFVISYVSS
ncbi:cupin domain-containing protein [Parageobacillus thermoglucosidasius]|uniref:cupin domain-containing protein n=1 Tax=Parageobacillus thermoglucosidasius TaxID=1426 RepID=UPI0002D6B15A|nr:cupin domain-containing protein [Parageobacillus thermoglucosidasius]KYD12739.1 hypothetical protein B4168_3642 [Anoxybacillus flavithermus]OAO87180.1 hypothetical protein GT23_1363 [Parageobacillus thermoglucosidasius]GAJ44098.1 hypothetical protein GT2_14_01120 [Parageobacillus thermoglucosidasius NBRC 107763]